MKTITQHIVAKKTINASKEAIFSIITDHENTHTWVKEVDKVLLISKGENINGLGAIRKVYFKPALWTTVEEEVTGFLENQSYTYKIISKMPGLVAHKGVWTLDETAQGLTKVVWDVHIEFKKMHWFSLFANGFAKAFGKVQHGALESLQKELSSSIVS